MTRPAHFLAAPGPPEVRYCCLGPPYPERSNPPMVQRDAPRPGDGLARGSNTPFRDAIVKSFLEERDQLSQSRQTLPARAERYAALGCRAVRTAATSACGFI